MGPSRRSNDVLVHEVGAELVVYDRERQIAHRLNETAAQVWQRLDGRTSAAEIAVELRYDPSVVDMALDHLRKAHLLDDASYVTRREAVRKVTRIAAAGAVLPVVSSIVAPTPAMAQSAGPGPNDPPDYEDPPSRRRRLRDLIEDIIDWFQSHH